MPECHERLKRIEIRNLDAVDFIGKYDHPRALFYCDPPYLHGTRHGDGDNNEYRHEMSERAHAILLATLSFADLPLYSQEMFDDLKGEENYSDYALAHEKPLLGKFMLSGYWSHLYENYEDESGWTRHEKIIDNKASSKKTKDKKVECVWTNY